MIAMIVLGLHLCSLQSMGVPYMTSFAPLRLQSQKDTFVRISRRSMRKYFGRN
ncbi:hypothetical protein D3C75_1150340 [compost metagenome]